VQLPGFPVAQGKAGGVLQALQSLENSGANLMRQTILRLVCDECGLIAHLEIANSEPLTATTDVAGMIERQGWRSAPKIGSSFSTHDTCPRCSDAKRVEARK
jgi:hypothetical protein